MPLGTDAPTFKITKKREQLLSKYLFVLASQETLQKRGFYLNNFV